MLREIAYWVQVLVVLWPVTIVLFAAVGISATNFATYRRTEADKKNIVLYVSVYLGAAVIAFVCITGLLLARFGCC